MALHRGPAGSQYRWDDYRTPFTASKQGITDKPDFDYTRLGLLFPNNDPTETVSIIAQMPHQTRLGSDSLADPVTAELRPHIHFWQEEAAQPTFKMDYRIAEQGGDPDIAFTTLTAVTFAFTYVSGVLLQIASFPAISLGAITGVSAMMDIIVYRDDVAVVGDVLGKEFDMHLQLSGWGSRGEFTP